MHYWEQALERMWVRSLAKRSVLWLELMLSVLLLALLLVGL